MFRKYIIWAKLQRSKTDDVVENLIFELIIGEKVWKLGTAHVCVYVLMRTCAYQRWEINRSVELRVWECASALRSTSGPRTSDGRTAGWAHARTLSTHTHTSTCTRTTGSACAQVARTSWLLVFLIITPRFSESAIDSCSLCPNNRISVIGKSNKACEWNHLSARPTFAQISFRLKDLFYGLQQICYGWWKTNIVYCRVFYAWRLALSFELRDSVHFE